MRNGKDTQEVNAKQRWGQSEEDTTSSIRLLSATKAEVTDRIFPRPPQGIISSDALGEAHRVVAVSYSSLRRYKAGVSDGGSVAQLGDNTKNRRVEGHLWAEAKSLGSHGDVCDQCSSNTPFTGT